jgi:hypothetical protein
MKQEIVMNITVKIIAALIVMLLPSALFAAATPMKEGLWEITTTMEMTGMPYKIPPTVTTHCYTKEDVKDSQKTVPEQKDCKVTEFKSSGNRTTWKMVCKGEHASKAEGEMIYKGSTAYEGTMKMVSEGREMYTKFKSKRIGDCK